MCMADGYCTNFFVTGNRKYTSSRNLKHFDEMLEEHEYYQGSPFISGQS